MHLHSLRLLLAVAFVAAAPLAAGQGPTVAARDALEHSDWFAEATRGLERAEYRFSALADLASTWSAPNRAHEFRTRVSAGGIEVTPRAADVSATWKMSLSTDRFGRIGAVDSLSAAVVRVTDERVELDHGALTEWFVNDERGLEQGWTIERAPRGSEPLWIGLDFCGDLFLRIDASARGGILVDAFGEPQLRYSGLMAFDATGRELDARLSPSPEGVGIAIDDVGAIYPLTVDPVLTGPAWTAEGDQAAANFGISVAPAGDVNGDGYSDVIVGAPGYSFDQAFEGRAYVYLGSDAGLSTSANWIVECNQAHASFGHSVATAGDVNGDGYSDVIIGAPSYDKGQTDEGAAFVYLGSSTGLSVVVAWTGESNQSAALFGDSVGTAGDVNGDGYSDVIVGAPWHDNGQNAEGRAYVYLGHAGGVTSAAAWTAESDQADANYGHAVATAGDVNADGFSDVIVGANGYDNGETHEGRAFVYLGSSSGLAGAAAWTAESDQSLAGFGSTVGIAGDVDGDGYSDVIVGAPGYDDAQPDTGRAFVYLGSGAGLATAATWTAQGDQAGAQLGDSVAMAGDLNGDGYSDVILGAPGYDGGQFNEGRTFVYLGSGTGLGIGAVWTAEIDQPGAMLGTSVATAGDVNGDGYSDVIAGAYGYDHDWPNEGGAFVYMGSATVLAEISATSMECDQAVAGFGRSVRSAGDVNGDGYSDVIVGAPYFDNELPDEGRAFVYLGSTAGLTSTAAWTAEGNKFHAQFGASVASAGDVNGDGFSDVIVGANQFSVGPAGGSVQGAAFVYLGSGSGLSSSASWSALGDEGLGDFGSAVASAGDVNGDGYGDVIVGANRQTLGGRAYVYLGSASGLATSAIWSAQSDQSASHFGTLVDSAGDVNGDGYSDVIVGALFYTNGESSEGRAFVYHGSRSGPSTSANWTAEGNQVGVYFGLTAGSAGDVNGDGYSDVIVGAVRYTNDQSFEGRAFVYMGSSLGLSTSANWTAEGNQANAGFGGGVASAGDVNGDGYGDVIVGAAGFDAPTDVGSAFVFLGSSSGLGNRAWSVDGDQAGSGFGAPLANAGDVNGDGYSDVIVGAYAYDGGQVNEGRTFGYLGNEGRGGWTRAPQQRQANDAAPIDLLGRSNDKHEFRIRLGFDHALTGFDWASGLTPKARLEWEVRPLRTPLDGTHAKSGAEQAITGSLLTFNELVQIHSTPNASLVFGNSNHVLFDAHRAYHWRARVRTNNPLLPVTPWVTIPRNNVTETKLRAGAIQRK